MENDVVPSKFSVVLTTVVVVTLMLGIGLMVGFLAGYALR